MKEYMYTYHYFQKRTLQRPSRFPAFVFQLVLVSSALFLAATLYFTK